MTEYRIQKNAVGKYRVQRRMNLFFSLGYWSTCGGVAYCDEPIDYEFNSIREANEWIETDVKVKDYRAARDRWETVHD